MWMRQAVMVGVAFLVASGCASADTEIAAAPAVEVDDLPVVDVYVDEDGPASLVEAVQQSEFVVVGEVVDIEPGARFYGHTSEDLHEEWTEDVGLVVRVERYLAGDGPDQVTINWPAYLSSSNDIGARTAVVRMGGVRRDLPVGSRYLFFLTDYGEPWGLGSTSVGAALVELDGDRPEGQRSDVFNGVDPAEIESLVADGPGDA